MGYKYNPFTGTFDDAGSGGAGTPGGTDTQIQFNDGGTFGADAGLAFNKTTGKLSVGGKIVTTSNPVLDLSQSWGNSAVIFTGIKFNVPSDVSAAGSLLIDLQVAGASKFTADKSGALCATEMRVLPVGGFVPLILRGNHFSNVYRTRVDIDSNGVKIYKGAFSEPLGIVFDGGSYLVPDSNNNVGIRNGINAQSLRLYGTYTDTSNYRRLTKNMSAAGVAEIKPEGAGTGATGNVLHISGLPTSNPGPGILWNNLGVVNVGA